MYGIEQRKRLLYFIRRDKYVFCPHTFYSRFCIWHYIFSAMFVHVCIQTTSDIVIINLSINGQTFYNKMQISDISETVK